uniref:response regulator n=1 Tax=Pararhizobium sp. IMCC3301 TaxID=3067904 RepID=UPI002742478A|nr:response regulator [Pararhizobium sp. IMCC3301]
MAQQRTLLIVEDDPFIAMDMEWEFSDRGYKVIIASDPASGARALTQVVPDFAILDYNLGKETSVPIANALVDAKIPFIYLTGRPQAVVDDASAPDAPIIPKPFNFDFLERTYLAASA